MRDHDTPNPALAAAISALELPAKWSGRLTAWLILPMVAVLLYEVVARYVFDRPTIWAYDITYMFYGSLFMLGASYTLQRGSHVRADFLYNQLAVRWQGAIDASMHLFLFFPAISIFFWLTLQSALTSWGQGERIPTSPWMPIVYPFKTVLPITGLLLLIQGIPELLKSVYAVIHNRRYPH